jgi:hypothetical protein
MRTTLHTASLLAAGLLAACSEPVTAPPSADLALDAAPAASAASMTTGSGVFTYDGIAWVGCINEEAHSVVSAPYTYHLVQTANGDEVYIEQWDKTAITGSLTGLSSGHYWTRVDNVSPMVIRSAGGGMMQYTFKGTFVSETGPTLEWTEVYHISSNANGRLVVDKYRANCRVR